MPKNIKKYCGSAYTDSDTNTDADADVIPQSAVHRSKSLSGVEEEKMPEFVCPIEPKVQGSSPDEGFEGNTDDDDDDEEESLSDQPVHPLQNAWTFWFEENNQDKDIEDNRHEVISLSSAEEFWSVFNHMRPPAQLKAGSKIAFFKQGIRPKWTDAENASCWILSFNDDTMNLEELKDCWLDILLCLIGEAFEGIYGATMQIGDPCKIILWMEAGRVSMSDLDVLQSLNMEFNVDASSTPK